MDYGISSSRNWQHINEIRTQKNACRMVPAVEGRYPANSGRLQWFNSVMGQ